jgi:hypothetical protein
MQALRETSWSFDMRLARFGTQAFRLSSAIAELQIYRMFDRKRALSFLGQLQSHLAF